MNNLVQLKLTVAAKTHERVHELQLLMHAVSRQRDFAVLEAVRAGVSRREVAERLGVNVQRVGVMVRAAEVEEMVEKGSGQ